MQKYPPDGYTAKTVDAAPTILFWKVCRSCKQDFNLINEYQLKSFHILHPQYWTQQVTSHRVAWL